MKKFIKLVTAITIFGGGNVFAMQEEPLEVWQREGYVIGLAGRDVLPASLQEILSIVQQASDVARTEEVVAAHRVEIERVRSEVNDKQSFGGRTVEHSVNAEVFRHVIRHVLKISNGTLTVTNLASCTYVLQFENADGNKLEWIVMLAKKMWYPPYCEDFHNQRYKYQLPSRMAYSLRIARIINERGLTHVETPESYLVMLKGDEEPTDDNSCYAIRRVDADIQIDFPVVCERARGGEQDSLTLVSEMLQVVYFVGLWDAYNNIVLRDTKAVFIDTECPGLGGNPWIHQQGDEAPVRPWLALTERGENKIKRDGASGLQQLWERLFGFGQGKLFEGNSDRQGWFEENILKGDRLVEGDDVFGLDRLRHNLIEFNARFRS